MVDENGAIRPIKFEIKAEVNVDGSQNVVGEAAVLEAIVGGKIPKPKTAEDGLVNSSAGIGEEENRKPKDGDARMGIRTKANGDGVNWLSTDLANGQAKEQADPQANNHARILANSNADTHELKEHRKREHSPPSPVDDDFDDKTFLPAADAKRARLQ